MADQSVRGRFVWHELVTPDSNASHAFYGKTIGWKSQPWTENSSYVMFAAQRGPVGATVARNGAVPHWLPYIGTGDVDKTIDLAKQNGGSVVKDVDTLSNGSRYAVLQDPYGAAFGVYESAEDYGKITPPKPGEHSWHELMTADQDGAFDFYAALFGWEKIVEHDMGDDIGNYLVYGMKGEQLGGILKPKRGGPGSAWLSYVNVKDVKQTAKKVKSAGGQVVNGPMEVPGGHWIIVAVDPQGAMFAAHALPASVKKPEKTEQAQPRQLRLETESPGRDTETPAERTPSEAPAEKAPARKRAPSKRAPAKKAPAKKAPARKAPAQPARKSGGKKKSSKKRPAARGAGSKKSAAKGAKKKVAKAKSKTRSGGKKKAVKKPRKGK